MLEKYNHLFDLHLTVCKAAYNLQKPYDNLDKCIRLCENLREQIIGMVFREKEGFK